MIVINTPPPLIADALTKIQDSGQFLFACRTELGPDGNYGEQWIAATDQLITIVRTIPTEIPPAVIPIGEIREARIEMGGGSGRLILELSSGRILRLTRFTSGETRSFGKATSFINALAEGRSINAIQLDPRELGLCRRCGSPLVEGANICPHCFKSQRVIGRLLKSTLPYWKPLIIITAISIISTAMSLAPPYLTRILVDRVFGQRQYHLLAVLAIALACIQVLSAGLGMISSRLRIFLANRLAFDGRNEILTALQRLPMAYFEKHQIGVITSRVIKDSDAVFDFWVEQCDQVVENVLLVVGVGLMLFLMNWKLALLVMTPAPIILATSVWLRRTLEWRWGRLWDKWHNLYGIIGDSLSGIRVVKTFAQETLQTTLLHRYSKDVYEADIEAHGLWNIYIPFLQLLIGSGAILVWFVGGKMVEHHDAGATLGTLIAFIGYMGMFYAPIRQMSRLADALPRTLTAIERVFDLIDTPSETYDPDDAIPMPDFRGEVEFQNVTFGYEPHQPVLKNISLHVKAGENIGLVGHSGAGKSTLAKLLSRFYTVNQGVILVDGVDIRRISLNDLRSHVGYVEQDPFLFSGSISSNIAFSRPGATRREIVEAAIAANAHEFIMRMPDGYDTQVGERGQRLSGGERQRLAIARAILHNPRILILDEPTSAVDLNTERKIQGALQRLCKGRTTFAIAHRLSTLRDCDRLVVLDRGIQMEVGNHDELIALGGLYADLVRIHSEVSRLVSVV